LGKLNTLTYEEVHKALQLGDAISENDKRNRDWALGWWRYALDRNAPAEIVSEHDQGLAKYNLADRLELAQFTANSIIDRFVPRE
jgi:hypothetical protein